MSVKSKLMDLDIKLSLELTSDDIIQYKQAHDWSAMIDRLIMCC